MNPRASARLKLVIGLIALAGLVLAVKFLNVQEWLKSFLAWVQSLGLWGPILFIGAYILACVCFVPGFILTLGAGLVFGVALGSIYVSIGATLGATAAFLVGRYFARDWVANKIGDNDRFRAIDEAIAREGWKIVGLLRLSPIIPFNLLNYALGVTRVSLRDYFLATWIGMIPATIVYVYFGSLAGSLSNLGRTSGGLSRAKIGLSIVGLLMAVAVTVYITRIARKALDRQLK
ncbi:MAG: TVP38/TMEM64 family protein [Verrucomicrobiota bacterium]